MACIRPFIVGAGCIPDHRMTFGSNSLSEVWGGKLIEYSCLEDPVEILDSIPQDEGLVQLIGDAAMHYSMRGSWLEVLGAWRQPIILMVLTTLPNGEPPGVAAAYAALCDSLHVPLVGIVQLGGYWDPLKRRSDGLPWCGWIPEDGEFQKDESNSLIEYKALVTETTVMKLRQRLMKLTN
jgi:hypothetical protein